MTDTGLKILIVDDEDLARQKIKRYARELEPLVCIEESANGLEAIAVVKEFRPQIVFLDIQMPGLNGFEVLDHFAERSFAIIFQTAFDEFAIKAFEENACDYLLKPFTRERFAKAFDRARRTSLPSRGENSLQNTLTAARRFLDKLCVDDRGVRILIDVDTIDAFVSRDHYTCLHSGGKEYLIDLSLQKLEERLDPASFARIHRATIVRVTAIRAMTKGDEPEVKLHCGLTLAVSRRCRGPLIERLKVGIN